MTGSDSGARVVAGDAGTPSVPARRRLLLAVVLTVSALIVPMSALTGVLDRVHLNLIHLAVAVAVLATAQLARIPLRIGSDSVMLAWGEAGIIVAVCLLPPVWVPLAAVVGVTAGHLYRLVGAAREARLRFYYSLGALTLGSATATTVTMVLADPIRPLNLSLTEPFTIGTLCLAALGYFAATGFLTSAWVAAGQVTSIWPVWLRTARGKRTMLVGNVAAGLGVALLISADMRWLFLLPPAVWLLHQGYTNRLRAAEERRTWEAFADATRALNHLDEGSVAEAALRGAVRLFSPDQVELVVTSPRARPRYYWTHTTDLVRVASPPQRGDQPADRGPVRFEDVTISARPVASARSVASGGPVADLSPATPDRPILATGHLVVRQLLVGQSSLGELRLAFRQQVTLTPREQHAFSAYADAIASAIHDAATHRQLRAITARGAYVAVHDPLTGLVNRSTLLARGNAELGGLGQGVPVSLIIFDVDDFRKVNDTLSHAAGDELLGVLGRRLEAARRPGELLGRLGGDEFALLLSGVAADDEALVIDRTRSITRALARPVEISGVTLAVQVSAGVVWVPVGGCDMTELLRRADVALYQAKRGGRRVARYVPATDATSTDRLALLADLRDALAADDQIVLELQPEIDLRTGAPRGVEALVRWRHPRHGTLAPAEFISVVEHSDLVGTFTRYVIERALAIGAGWATQGLHLPIAVNLSARSLLDPDLPAAIEAGLATYNVSPARLVMEITETVMISDLPVIDEVVAALRAIGVQVSVDDFGTGFSSLGFLTRVLVDEVKIDRMFVTRMIDSPEAAAIVRTTVELARELGLRVVAEGVELPAQRDALAGLGADAAQGYLFYPALPVEQATAVLQAASHAAAVPPYPLRIAAQP